MRTQLALCLLVATTVQAQQPWKDTTLSPDRRADLVVQQMTLAEKIQLVHGTGYGVLIAGSPVYPGANHGAGFVPGIPRLGIPNLDLADSAVGVRMSAYDGRYSTLLPSVLGLASSWDLDAANLYGQVIGRELRAQGYNMSIGGGVDLTREPRNGRNFEYSGEDPVLAGNIVGALATGVQSQHVMGDIKHYALNDQETGRTHVNVQMDIRVMRETDLLAFDIAIHKAHPAGVMCSYNLVNGTHACENDYLLKQEWGFQGFVLSDWEGTHSTVASALAGLDMEQPFDKYFGQPLEDAVKKGVVPQARLDDMVHRILRSMFLSGVIDNPPIPRHVPDPFQGRDDAQHIAEESIVLLKNQANQLPLSPTLHHIAIIGGHADAGVLSGGGSAQVDPPGGNVLPPHEGTAPWGSPVYFPSAPMKYIRRLAPSAQVTYDPGTDTASAAALAHSSDVAIVFATQFMSEAIDAPSLSLPNNQDALIEAVAAANPHTIVVLETGGPVSMPWVDRVHGVLAAWYPGIAGGEAIADLLFGVANPSAKLSITFAKTDTDLPNPVIAGIDQGPPGKEVHFDHDFNMSYKEGLAVGYRWYEVTQRQPLFAFGHGLSYTTFRYASLQASPTQVQFQLSNTGSVPGVEIAQLYVRLPTSAMEPFQRLAGWQRVQLAPGESKTITIPLDPHFISVWDTPNNHWKLVPGDYELHVSSASDQPQLKGVIHFN
jgi:beta-glucosidase